MGVAADVDLLARSVRNPGRLVLAPASVTGAFPYGGTPLGLTRGADAHVDVRYYENRDPASGAISEIARRSVDFLRLVFLIEGPGWDEDLVAAAFAKSRTSGNLPYRAPAETRAEGTIIPTLVQAQAPILFVADDPNGRSVYFRRPLVIFSFGQAIPLSLQRKAGLPIVILPTPDSGALTTGFWQSARLENITL